MNLLERLYLWQLTQEASMAAAFERAAEQYDYFQKASKSVLIPTIFETGTIVHPTLEQLPAAEEELRWRTVQVWEAHLAENNAFFQAENGVAPSVQPTMTPDIRKSIREAMKLFDSHLLTPDKREEWKRNSKVRAAGVGIYLSQYHTGTSKDNNVKDGGTRYLEHWRPWRHQRGKGHPVETFAQLYFEARDVRA